MFTIGLVGNPNSGKTTLFNALTGASQRVGNWPGVTVERKSGFFKWQDNTVEVVDLPGTYSLTCALESSSLDERVACEFLLKRQADVIVNILDASNLERNLYLTTQLIEMQVPVILAVNMLDVARKRHITVSLEALEKTLGCPVVGLEALKGKGIKELKSAIVTAVSKGTAPSQKAIPYPHEIEVAIGTLAAELNRSDALGTWYAMRLLEDDALIHSQVASDIHSQVKGLQLQLNAQLDEDVDILLADARYRFIHEVVTHCVKKTSSTRRTWTARIDDLVLNRFLAIPLFLVTMYSMFFFAINMGGAFQDFFDIAGDTIFVAGWGHLLESIGAPTWLVALLANGVGKGITTTLTFIPVIGAMFLALAFLEDSGYMARASFVVDRLMRSLGLPGKSFLPMIVGFGCNVPALMSARTLENKRDRILTVMMTPFMSCGARLAIFAVFATAFFPTGGQNVVFALYIIGILMAMLTGLLLRKTLLKGEPAPLVMELPPYHVPHLKSLWLNAWQRLKGFVFKAGKLIIPICVIIGALNALNLNGTINSGEGDSHSLLSQLGQVMSPLFAPMGIQADNWPATVGLMTGVLAKEVVVGTLNSLYSQMGHLASVPTEAFNFWGGLQEAVSSIPNNLMELGGSLANPVLAKAPVHTLSQSVYGLMYEHFDGKIGAMAYLLFVLLYFPCVSTVAVMARELNRAWAIFSVLWTTGVAYGAAVIFYQAATLTRHPESSLLWILGISLVFAGVIWILNRVADNRDKIGVQYELARH